MKSLIQEARDHIERQLKGILTGTYCATALTYEKEADEFVIFSWGDAPVYIEDMGKGKTIQDAIDDYNSTER